MDNKFVKNDFEKDDKIDRYITFLRFMKFAFATSFMCCKSF